jgi:hypothetical protein
MRYSNFGSVTEFQLFTFFESLFVGKKRRRVRIQAANSLHFPLRHKGPI